MKFDGIYIAPVTPVNDGGSINWAVYEQLLSFLLERGVDGFCIGGGTSEYIHFSIKERMRLFDIAAADIPGGKRLFAAIGASSFSRVIELGAHADRLKADAVLLPMPHFFTYSQDDLEFFCRRVSRQTESPVVLYDLPFFTNPLESESILRLLEEEDGIVGIKDSSGKTGRFKQFAEKFAGDSGKEVSLLIGQDPFALEALESGWDGIISGLGCLCPELLVCLHESFKRGDLSTAARCRDLINEIKKPISGLPVPWAIRYGLEVRGIPCGPVSLPLSAERKAGKKEYQAWFENWLENNSGLWQNYS